MPPWLGLWGRNTHQPKGDLERWGWGPPSFLRLTDH